MQEDTAAEVGNHLFVTVGAVDVKLRQRDSVVVVVEELVGNLEVVPGLGRLEEALRNMRVVKTMETGPGEFAEAVAVGLVVVDAHRHLDRSS